ncbi:hypothetical protein LC609_33040 [Nostoc sp. XA013]|nr:hypothetical protein [Nostoc sp. XA013]
MGFNCLAELLDSFRDTKQFLNSAPSDQYYSHAEANSSGSVSLTPA